MKFSTKRIIIISWLSITRADLFPISFFSNLKFFKILILIYIYIYIFFFKFFFYLAVLYGFLRSGGFFPVLGVLHTSHHNGTSTCSRYTTAMEEREQSSPETPSITISGYCTVQNSLLEVLTLEIIWILPVTVLRHIYTSQKWSILHTSCGV